MKHKFGSKAAFDAKVNEQIAAHTEASEILAGLGARVVAGYDGGGIDVMLVHDELVINVPGPAWDWFKPLLVELLEYRGTDAVEADKRMFATSLRELCSGGPDPVIARWEKERRRKKTKKAKRNPK